MVHGESYDIKGKTQKFVNNKKSAENINVSISIDISESIDHKTLERNYTDNACARIQIPSINY